MRDLVQTRQAAFIHIQVKSIIIILLFQTVISSDCMFFGHEVVPLQSWKIDI